MNLLEGVRIYVERKRSEGLHYERPALTLAAFIRHVGETPFNCITQRQVLTFLNGPRTSTVTWRSKCNLIRNFLEYWAARGELQTPPMPPDRPPCRQTFIPYIYSGAELRTLLNATRLSQKLDACRIDVQTFRVLLLFLYATGARVGEALRLFRSDVDLKKKQITIRGNRFNRKRCIPIGSDLHKVLQGYLEQEKQQLSIPSPYFFVNKDGEAINVVTLAKSFQRLRRIAGIARHDGACYQPRMHDLRHTFAVHRLTAWIKHGADLNRMLPALAVYIGQAGLVSTEQYLSLTPERFRKQLVKLSPQRATKRWRNDPALMKFLAEL